VLELRISLESEAGGIMRKSPAEARRMLQEEEEKAAR
jgi:hypothetical protein